MNTAYTRVADGDEWEYDRTTNRYRNKRSGRFMSHSRVITMRDQYLTGRQRVVTGLVNDVVLRSNGVQIGSPAWNSVVSDMSRVGWREVESTFITEYALGKGGAGNLTPADLRKLDGMLAEQRVYWDGFMDDVRSGRVHTEAGISNRMNMYTNASRRFHSTGMADAWGIVLPTYPGEQVCGPGCRCSWRIRRTKRGVEAFWELGGNPATSCPECLENALYYRPYLIEEEEE